MTDELRIALQFKHESKEFFDASFVAADGDEARAKCEELLVVLRAKTEYRQMAKEQKSPVRFSKKTPECPHCTAPYRGDLEELFQIRNCNVHNCQACGRRYSVLREVTYKYSTMLSDPR